MMKKTFIFDMDGLIADTEPLWQKAEVKIFNHVNVPLTYDMCNQTTGLRIDAAVDYWYQRYPWTCTSTKEIENQIVDCVEGLIKSAPKAMKGAVELINKLHQEGFTLAICSSSPMKLILAVVEAFNLQPFFKVLHSAENDQYGKPNPEPYLSTIKKLGVSPSDCLVFEDSFNGMLAAKAAQMTVIGVPEEGKTDDPRIQFCDVIIANLSLFTATDIYKNMSSYKRTREPVHPGRILNEDILAELGINVTQAAKMLGVSRKYLADFIDEQVDCSAEMAHRLAIATKTSVASWLNMQHALNIWREENNTTSFSDVQVFATH
jgi:addiction module HigA family antidote